MSALIDELKKEHSILVNILKEVKEEGISTSGGREKLMKAKTTLLGHLKKEDDQMYPILKAKANTDVALKSMLDTFAKDMDQISTTALNFFAKYESGGSPIEFAKDFGNIYASLGSRIRKEETILYEEFNKIA